MVTNNTAPTKKVERPQGDELSSQLVALYKTLRGLDLNQPVNFDFSLITWINPLLILPIGSLIQTAKSSFTSSSAINSYLDAIRFPEGVSTVHALQQTKTYIPIPARTGSDVDRRRGYSQSAPRYIHQKRKGAAAMVCALPRMLSVKLLVAASHLYPAALPF